MKKRKIECVVWENNIKSIKKAIAKKNKLENQGYILKKNTMTIGNVLIYINYKYRKEIRL
jgi:hypothetical protein